MNFYAWLRHRGLSPSSASKYVGAIEGALSTWATEAGLTSTPLAALTSKVAFDRVDALVRGLSVFQERNARGHHMYSSALVKFGEYLGDSFASDVEADIEQILEDSSLTRTERTDLVKCRIGQGTFRQRVVTYWKSCSVTGYTDTRVLLASHIKPWRACTNAERLDPFNGLLLTPNLDRAFDGGLVTFSKDGGIVFSVLLTQPYKLGITPDMKIKLAPKHEAFMGFHREHMFRGA
ncbi:HNH endonuclease [Variovorax sp. W2I14]|uniref:HNH endonuclease n=1 Tax=Variovorax sp. W2I14 TaxID=3042290 RepID=UPI003D1D43B7